ncbi:MAG TPA: ATP-binding cassette domain-containing protein [Vitreimonas sp.]|jgi:ABC-2 type transport system ATP-binding protein|nr:ATP-binding cassette domain-containing protein [Vitreimonas sp.]
MQRHDARLAVESVGLGKSFGDRIAVADVALSVEPGVIYGFLGPNGAGKTTTIRLMLGLLRPSAGQIKIFGCDVAAERKRAARHVGALLEARATYDHLTGYENLDATRRVLDLPATEITRVLELVDLREAAHRRVGHYSLGMRQRLGLARALLGAPRLLVLDEPMNGLDPDGMRDMRDSIRSLPERTGATVFLSSHLLGEVQQTATHVGLMHSGRLVKQGPLDALLQHTAPELTIRTNDPAKALIALRGKGYAPTLESQVVRVHVSGGDAEAAAINNTLIGAGLGVYELSFSKATLEALYVSLQNAQREAA